jgi:hypothetical protein
MRYLNAAEIAKFSSVNFSNRIAFFGDSYPVSAHRGDIGQEDTYYTKYLMEHLKTEVKRIPFSALCKEGGKL